MGDLVRTLREHGTGHIVKRYFLAGQELKFIKPGERDEMEQADREYREVEPMVCYSLIVADHADIR
jgi:hypothetical protein